MISNSISPSNSKTLDWGGSFKRLGYSYTVRLVSGVRACVCLGMCECARMYRREGAALFCDHAPPLYL